MDVDGHRRDGDEMRDMDMDMGREVRRGYVEGVARRIVGNQVRVREEGVMRDLEGGGRAWRSGLWRALLGGSERRGGMKTRWSGDRGGSAVDV